MNFLCCLLFCIVWWHMVWAMDDFEIANRCHPQKTPLYGKKWCNFKQSADEVGAKCYFTCNEGYYLTQTEYNECIHQFMGMIAIFDREVGNCLPRPPLLKIGENGPFQFSAKIGAAHWGIVNGRLIDSFLYKSNNFFVQLPGLNQKNNSVSIYTSGQQKEFVVNMEDKLIVEAKQSDQNDIEKFFTHASFIFHQDLFYPGFSCFESMENDGKFIMVVGNGLSLSMSTPNSESARMRGLQYNSFQPPLYKN